jgi:hypothetical protein
MFQSSYYPAIIKKTIASFGKLFSGIQIERKDNNGNLIQTVNVPIAYSNKEKWVTRTEQDASQTNNTQITLPRLAFEITNYSYDSTRKVNKNNRLGNTNQNLTSNIQYSGVPYNLDVSLYLITKTIEDGLVVMEKILPMFTPNYTISINAVPEMNVVKDVPIILNSVTVDDNYENEISARREIIHTFSFTLKLELFGSIATSSVIKHVNVNLPIQSEHYRTSAVNKEDVPDNLSEDYWFSTLMNP